MSSTLHWPRIILPVTLLLVTSSCTDDPGEDEETEFRGCPNDCSGGAFGNTNFVGVHSFANVSRIYGAVSNNSYTPNPALPWIVQYSYNRVQSASCKLQEVMTTMGPWQVDIDGQLMFQYPGGSTLYLKGTEVLGCVFHMQFSTDDDFIWPPPENVDVKVSQVTPVTRRDGSPGFNYVFTSPNNEFNNKIEFQPGEFGTCSPEPGVGDIRLALRPGLRLNWDNWSFSPDPDVVVAACASGADGHSIFQLNVPVFRLLDPLIAMADIGFWGLRYQEVSNTIPGNQIDVRDRAGLSYKMAPRWGLEARWGAYGPICKGYYNRNLESRGLGWDDFDPFHNLPYCVGEGEGIPGDPDDAWYFETSARCRTPPPGEVGIQCIDP